MLNFAKTAVGEEITVITPTGTRQDVVLLDVSELRSHATAFVEQEDGNCRWLHVTTWSRTNAGVIARGTLHQDRRGAAQAAR